MNDQSPFDEIRCDAYNDDPTRVGRVAVQMPDQKRLDLSAAMLKSVAEPTRLRILFALSLEPLCVCELATLLFMSMPAVSHHLRLLSDADLIRVKKSGRFACYFLTEVAKSGPVQTVLSSLTNDLAGASA
jgi:ArsR family transcriptional regulator